MKRIPLLFVAVLVLLAGFFFVRDIAPVLRLAAPLPSAPGPAATTLTTAAVVGHWRHVGRVDTEEPSGRPAARPFLQDFELRADGTGAEVATLTGIGGSSALPFRWSLSGDVLRIRRPDYPLPPSVEVVGQGHVIRGGVSAYRVRLISPNEMEWTGIQTETPGTFRLQRVPE